MSDFSAAIADDIGDALFDDSPTDILPVSNVYVTVFDDTDTERDDDFENARRQTSPSDWIQIAANAGAYENDVNLSLGTASGDVNNLEDVALFDAATGGNELARYTMQAAPFDVSGGTELVFETGDLSFDVEERD